MNRTLLLIAVLCLVTAGLFANTQVVSPRSSDYDSWKQNQVVTPQISQTPTTPSQAFTTVRNGSKDGSLMFPLDGSYTLALGANDDDYTDPIALPFTFMLYGVPYTQFYINNNGNVTFDMGYSSYTPWGFPIEGAPMLAPFFADVDTRGMGSGYVWYKIESNRVIVTWDAVGYFGAQVDRLNTFQVIFSDGTDASIGLGNNVAFSYGEMSWTTGDASGGSGGLGGTPATVGVNAGDGVLYAQTGRFDHEGYDYDGAFDNNDGIDWLDWVIFYYDAADAEATLTITPQAIEVVVEGPGLPEGLVETDPTISTYFATYPLAGSQNVYVPVGAGEWRGWIYHTGAWHEADVFPVTGPGTIVFTNVPFTGGKEDIPIIVQGEEEVLPVELSSFSATMSAENYVNILWTTQTETNLTGFYIYRGTEDDLAYAEQISLLIEPTNSSTQHQYIHTDNTLVEEGVYYYWLQVAEMDGSNRMFGPTAVNYSFGGGEHHAPDIQPVAGISSIYPNPTSSHSLIRYEVIKGTDVTFNIFNARGQLVNSFDMGYKPGGTWSLNWNGNDAAGKACPNGLYFVRMTAGGQNYMRKAVLLK